MSLDKHWSPETVAVHAGIDKSGYYPAVPPIYETSTFGFDSVEQGAALFAGPAVAFEVTEFDGLVLEKDGTASVQAGAHPYEATNSLGVNLVTEAAIGGEVPEESVKDIEVGLPAGMVGNPRAAHKHRHIRHHHRHVRRGKHG